MKFGQYLLENSIPAWSTQYIDYNKLKAILKELKQFNDKIRVGSLSSSSNTLSILRPISVVIDETINNRKNQRYLNSLSRKENINLITKNVKFDLNYLMPIIENSVERYYHKCRY